jgi:hypothetical protein
MALLSPEGTLDSGDCADTADGAPVAQRHAQLRCPVWLAGSTRTRAVLVGYAVAALLVAGGVVGRSPFVVVAGVQALAWVTLVNQNWGLRGGRSRVVLAAGAWAWLVLTGLVPVVYDLRFVDPPTHCAAVEGGAQPYSSNDAGTRVRLTATASGCATPEYRFWAALPSNPGNWTLIRDWGDGAAAWDVSDLPPGVYHLGVWVRTTTSSDDYQDAASFFSYRHRPSPPCTAVSAQFSSPMPGSLAAPLELSASASGCNSAEYKWWVATPGSMGSALLRDWGGPTANWHADGQAAGVYQFAVWARATGDPDEYQSAAFLEFRLD